MQIDNIPDYKIIWGLNGTFSYDKKRQNSMFYDFTSFWKSGLYNAKMPFVN